MIHIGAHNREYLCDHEVMEGLVIFVLFFVVCFGVLPRIPGVSRFT